MSKLNLEDPEGDDDISLNQKTWKKEPKPEKDDSDGDAEELNQFCLEVSPSQDGDTSSFALRTVKFIYSEKATTFCEISIVDLTVTTKD